MRITVIFEDGDVHEYDAEKVVVQTGDPVLIAANSAYEIVLMEKKT
jgi:hypothetical protein